MRSQKLPLAYLFPAAVLIAIVGIYLWLRETAVVGASAALLDFGASYAPRSAGLEPWRLLTSLFIHNDPWVLAGNAMALLLIGRLIVSLGGISLFAFLYILAGSAGAVTSSLLEPESVFFGAGPSVWGLIGAASIVAFRDNERRLDRAALGVSLLHILATFATVESLQGASALAQWAGLLTGAAASLILLRFPLRDLASQGASLIILVSALGFAYSRIEPGVDRFQALAKLDSSNARASSRLLELQNALVGKTIATGEFAKQVNTELIAPIDFTLQHLSLVGKESGKPADWVDQERARLEFKRQALEIVRDIYAAKDQLLKAEQLIRKDTTETEARLNSFWTETLPALRQRHENLEKQYALDPHDAKALEQLRDGLAKDIRDLMESAVDVEILRTETWLLTLRKSIRQTEDRSVAATQEGPQVSLSAVAADADSYLRRLKTVTSRVDKLAVHNMSRLAGMQSHLEQIQSVAQ